MRITRVVLTLLTYPHLCGKPLTYTTCLACILQSGMHYTLQHSYHNTPQFTMNPYQTSALPPIIYLQQFRRWPRSRQHTSILRWGRRFPNSTSRWWTLDSRNSAWKNFCIHKNGLPNNVCQHPCPYGNNDTVSYMDSLDLSDILDYEDYMMTTSDDED